MEAFKPSETPVMKKILFSPVLHVTLIFIFVFVAIFFIRQRQREELRARVEFLKGGPVLVERPQKAQGLAADANSVQNSGAAPAPPSEVKEVPTNPSAATASSATAGSISAGTAQPISGASPASETAAVRAGTQALANANRTTPNRAVVIYAEIDRRVLNTWMNELRTMGQLRSFDSVTMGPLPQISQKLKNPGIKILQQLELSLANQPSPYEWFAGTHRTTDTDNEMGFFSSLVLSDTKDGLIHGELEVQRAFRDPNDPTKTMERISFGGPFEMPMGSGFVMRGLLPSKYASELSEENNSDPFLSVFKSRAFRTEETELTLILDFDTGGPQSK
jgi:hypothetical protein